ncbi:hypothetical protein D9615_009716 [Tricholomella constricta]|uniref:GH15-like domain-containing protein n=1 Tax=Tricholomella constricta TaxID=117010 RepID=A0A8H5GSX6_9AGAR|nr:hypothetical protein D9615_009716 [Tricholomella constricta]
MLWVAIDRGLRLAEKRSLPCPNRLTCLEARDELYEEIMHKAWNAEGWHFGQGYEETDVLDSAVLIMPLVFFMHGSDPRFVSTLKQILKTPERGGLTSNNLVYQYDVRKSDDGVGGEEGTISSTFDGRCVEALTRAGEYDKPLLPRAVSMFGDFLLYLNHVGLCTEEISEAGEALGNAVQGFTAGEAMERRLGRTGVEKEKPSPSRTPILTTPALPVVPLSKFATEAYGDEAIDMDEKDEFSTFWRK